MFTNLTFTLTDKGPSDLCALCQVSSKPSNSLEYVMDGEDFYILMAVIENIIIGKMLSCFIQPLYPLILKKRLKCVARVDEFEYNFGPYIYVLKSSVVL